MKSELFDRRLRLNGAVYLYKYRDIQLSQSFVNTTRIFNAARATVKGLDFQAVALIAPGLTLDAGTAFLDAKYDDFPGAPAPTPRPATCAPVPTQLPGGPTGGDLNCNINAGGLTTIRSPKFTGSIGANYEWLSRIGTFVIRTNYLCNSGFAFAPDNRLRQVLYDLLNAQISWRTPSERFGVTVFGRNLLDEQYYANRISGGGGDTYTAAAPLTGGVAFNMKSRSREVRQTLRNICKRLMAPRADPSGAVGSRYGLPGPCAQARCRGRCGRSRGTRRTIGETLSVFPLS